MHAILNFIKSVSLFYIFQFFLTYFPLKEISLTLIFVKFIKQPLLLILQGLFYWKGQAPRYHPRHNETDAQTSAQP
jgi:hypothetical protein